MGVDRGGTLSTGTNATTFEALFRERFDPMVRLASLLTGDHHVAEELTMDAFERVAPRLDDIEHPAAYVRAAVINAARSHHRRRAVDARLPVPVEPTPTDHRVDELWDRLGELRPDERACVVLRFYEDLPLAAIAEQLDLPLGTVKSHIHRALATLRTVLTEEDR